MSSLFQIKTSALFGIDQVLGDLGVNPDDWLKTQNCSMALINRQDNTMATQHFISILQNSAQHFDCPDFGLKLGAKQDFRILGPLGLLLRNCTTPREALKAARGFMTFHNQSEYWDYSEQGDKLYLKRYEIFHDLSDTRQYKELSFSACYQLCQLLMGSGFRGVRMELSHAPISKQSVYDKFFKMPVLFNCEQDQMVIPAHYLDTPIPNADQTIHEFAAHYMQQCQQQNQVDMLQQVSYLIQQTMGDQHQSIDNIANMLGLSRRTLQRRLKQQGIVFKSLLQNTRVKTACWYLTSSNIDITLLSEMLGYSDISGFSRAFKSIKGCSPLAWRKQHCQAS